ncbi:MAG: hypothetical protein IT331_13580 [Anaerolineae bacterium]|nr:hypothetical protein [Anaerolineae bacterium]
MTLFLFSIAFTALLFGAFKIALAFLRRAFPDGAVLFESVETFLWVPAALFSLLLTSAVARNMP